ncbi:Glyoxalase/bleomycin resistance protein/dioxygenase [Paenibacillus curdlanolyticus YK9]|uniref:Glyoxalase/bleomycin resistance protein/dioxygenase n=1 Tax=Paenibacillus curdlanolyticus YK9 TaxID=717606 RepID=E0I5C8_9BACL|nr:VOC family protein [Paenibacillus curdlanolyticus]EFM12170.1 Glyoxalase/bleomycin resistance protein/dioxygenase [Paenibacillus curdlanolyticus YK9]
MINQIGQIMLYVNDQDLAKRFWTEKAGFVVVSEEDNGQGFRYIEIAPVKGAQTTFVLHNKQFIAQMQPELNLGTPSIMLFTDELDSLYQSFKEKDITVGDLVSIPGGRVFNFADDENNYFAVMEKK